MSKTQLHPRPFHLEVIICITDDLSQQIALGIGLMTAIQRTRSMHQIPPHILPLPKTVDFLGSEDVCQIGLLVEMRIHLEQSHLDEIVVQPDITNHPFDRIRMDEQEIHQAFIMLSRAYILIIGSLCITPHTILPQNRILMVHIPHILLRSLHRDTQLGIGHRHHIKGGAH